MEALPVKSVPVEPKRKIDFQAISTQINGITVRGTSDKRHYLRHAASQISKQAEHA